MAKYIQKIAIVLAVSVFLCSASPARLGKQRPLKSIIFARQELAEDIPTQTPYPPAGIKPEIPFDLPSDAKLEAPDNTYLPPVGDLAQTYGPPEVSVNNDVEDVLNDEPLEKEEQPEEVQSEESQPEEPQVEEEVSEIPSQQSEEVQSEESQPEEPQVEEELSEIPSQQSEEEQQVDDLSKNDTDNEIQQIESEIEQVLEEEGLNIPLPERLVSAKRNTKKTAKLTLAKLQLATPLRRQSVVAQPTYVVGSNGQLYRLLH